MTRDDRDRTHLHALELALSHERERLHTSVGHQERTLRQVWVSQLEKEIAGERAFLGMSANTDIALDDDDLLAALHADAPPENLR